VEAVTSVQKYLDAWEKERAHEVPGLGRFTWTTRPEKSWHVPTLELLQLMKRYSPILSVFSGLALTERGAVGQGADVICTDIKIAPNRWCQGTPVMKVEKIRCDRAMRRYPNRNVFMAWPPFGDPSARKCAEQIKTGRKLIYVGEDWYGCNADDSFFDLMGREFREIETLRIPRFSGINDSVVVYERL